MFTYSFQIFRLFGIPIRIDASWFIIAILVVWSLGVGLPTVVQGLAETERFDDAAAEQITQATYWAMAVIGALGLFGSVLLHELGHALEARRHGVPMRSITLFIFGGVAEMTEEPPNAKAEFLVAVAGPAVSLLLAVVFFFAQGLPLPVTVFTVVYYLALINFLLLVFNMIPAFPLDGGRVLRAILWHYKGSMRWATRITASIGGGFGLFLIAVGIIVVIVEFPAYTIQGIWLAIIGMFLRAAASMSYQQVVIRRALEGEPVWRFMHDQPRTVPAEATLEQLVYDYIYRYNYKMYPVQSNGHVLGLVTLNQLREVPREQWPQRHVSDIVQPCDQDNCIAPDADAMEALAQMNRTGASRMMVIDREGHLHGVLSLKDLMGFISLKVELGEEEDMPTLREN